jgi:chemotaxis protein CheX
MIIKSDYSDIFVEAWKSILVNITGEDIITAEICPVASTDRAICVEMAMVGDISAQIILGMDETTGRTIASSMLGGMEMENMDEIIPSAIGELCNMVMGTACFRYQQI